MAPSNQLQSTTETTVLSEAMTARFISMRQATTATILWLTRT